MWGKLGCTASWRIMQIVTIESIISTVQGRARRICTDKARVTRTKPLYLIHPFQSLRRINYKLVATQYGNDHYSVSDSALSTI